MQRCPRQKRAKGSLLCPRGFIFQQRTEEMALGSVRECVFSGNTYTSGQLRASASTRTELKNPPFVTAHCRAACALPCLDVIRGSASSVCVCWCSALLVFRFSVFEQKPTEIKISLTLTNLYLIKGTRIRIICSLAITGINPISISS